MNPNLAVRSALAADARLTVVAGSPQQLRWSQSWPIVLRPTGQASVHLVHGAGGPLAGDAFSLAIEIGPGAELDLRSAAATLVQPGLEPGAARWDVTATVAEQAALHWAPEPTIVTDGAALESTVRVDIGAGGSAVVQEIVVLGRHGKRGGRYRGSLVATVAGEPLCTHVTLLDGHDTALSGPGGIAGARAVATVLVAGRDGGSGAGEQPGARWAWTGLDGPGAMLLAVGAPGAVTRIVERECAGLLESG